MTTRKSPRQRRREALIKLGLELFSARAYDDISIDEIAEAAGMSKGLLYYYYPTKRDFYVGVLEAAAEELMQVTTPDPGLTPLEQLRQSVSEYLRYVAEHAQTYIAVLRGNLGNDPVIGQISNRVRQFNAARTLENFTEAERQSPVLQLAIIGWISHVEAMSLAWLQGEIGTQAVVCELSVRAFLSALRDARALDSSLAFEHFEPYL